MATELRRSSSSSSVDSSPPSSPLLAATDSSAHLILIHDEDGNQAFDFSSDDDDSQPEPEVQIRRSSAPPLSPFIVFIYLVDPYLKLGATLLPNSGLPIVFGLGALVGSAFLAAFARQILYLLARHLRKSDAEEVVLDAFARGRNKERHRSVLRGVLRTGAAFYKCLLASIYMKGLCYRPMPFLPAHCMRQSPCKSYFPSSHSAPSSRPPLSLPSFSPSLSSHSACQSHWHPRK